MLCMWQQHENFIIVSKQRTRKFLMLNWVWIYLLSKADRIRISCAVIFSEYDSCVGDSVEVDVQESYSPRAVSKELWSVICCCFDDTANQKERRKILRRKFVWFDFDRCDVPGQNKFFVDKRREKNQRTTTIRGRKFIVVYEYFMWKVLVLLPFLSCLRRAKK